MKQDLDISNVDGKPKRDRIRIKRKKYDELVAERDRLKAEKETLLQTSDFWENEYNRLKADNKQLKKDYDLSTNHVHEMTALYAKYERMSNKLRDQRDLARFIAALLGLAPFGFAVAVWLGKLIPVT